MKKQNTEIPSHFTNYLIPHLKNKITRTYFQQKVHSWLQNKLQNIVTPTNQNLLHQSQNISTQSVLKKCESIQKQFRLKYSIKEILPNLPFQYYETIILYIMQKKLFWIYRSQTDSQDQHLRKHKEIEVSFNLKLKKIYKNFQFDYHRINTASQIKSTLSNSFNTLNSSKNSFKKVDTDFQYNLLLVISVYLVAAFFQNFFTQLLIDNLFKSQIYIILNHAFLDLQVSLNVFQIMRKKYTFEIKVNEYNSINVSQINEKSIIQSKKPANVLKKSLSRKQTFLDNNQQLCPTEGKPTLNKIEELTIQQHSTREITQKNKNTTSIHRMNSTAGFSSLDSQKIISKKAILVKPFSSIQQSVSMKNSNQKVPKIKSKKSLHNNQHYKSRFNSFLRDARQFSVPTILKQVYGQNYLPSPQVIDFYSTIKKNLHVDSLPVIVKKKMNINQYQKLNELNNLQEIKRQVNSLDISSKKNHIKSNDLSLAMNTFISTSTKIPKKKRHQTNIQIVQNLILNYQQQQNHENKQRIQNQQQYRFEQTKLPIKASNLKLPYQKSAKIYEFTDEITSKDTKRSKKQNKTLFDAYQLLSMRKKTQNHKVEQEQREMEKSLQQKKKKSPCQWKNYLNLLKKHQSKENIATFVNEEQKKSEHKKNLQRKSYLRQKQQEKNYLMSTSNSKPSSPKLIKNGSTNTPQQSLILNKTKKSSQSMNTSLVNLNKLQESRQHYNKVKNNKCVQIQIAQNNVNQSEQISKYSSLEGQVNIHNENQTINLERYDSFELRKRFKQFEINCKVRDQKINYSIFKINNFKNLNS